MVKSYIWHVGGPNPCKVCKEKDGQTFEGEFESAHPNCTCWPEYLPETPWSADSMMTEIAPGIYAAGPVGGGETYVLGKARDVPLWLGKAEGAKVAFVAASPGHYDALRGIPLAGSDGLAFKQVVLDPLGLEKDKVGITYLVPRNLKARGRSRPPRGDEIASCRSLLVNDLRSIQPQIIVALGSQAAQALGDQADVCLPHPEAMAKANKDQIARKVEKIKQKMAKAEKGFYAQKLFLWPERRALLKALPQEDEEKHLVYAIVLEPDTPDGEGDVFSAAKIEEIAHKYTGAINREFQNWHSGKSFQAELVESEVAKTDYIWQGQQIKKGSWVVCIHILSDWMWRLVRAGIYRGISVGGGYIHVLRT